MINYHLSSFFKNLLMEHNAKNICKLSSAIKNKIWINKWLNLEFSYFFNTALKS